MQQNSTPYSKEFIRQVVMLCESTSSPVEEIAVSLGIAAELVHKWRLCFYWVGQDRPEQISAVRLQATQTVQNANGTFEAELAQLKQALNDAVQERNALRQLDSLYFGGATT